MVKQGRVSLLLRPERTCDERCENIGHCYSRQSILETKSSCMCKALTKYSVLWIWDDVEEVYSRVRT